MKFGRDFVFAKKAKGIKAIKLIPAQKEEADKTKTQEIRISSKKYKSKWLKILKLDLLH